MTDRQLEYLFHHVFLPPRVPHSCDQGDGSGDRALADLLVRLASQFRDQNDAGYYQAWTTICRILRTFADLHRHDNNLSASALKTALKDVGEANTIVLHIVLQNSCLIIRKTDDDYLIESFEASPPAATVLSAQRALQWDFPSRAVTVPIATFENSRFQESFVDFLEKASNQPVKQFAAATLKAGSRAYESRDTTRPAIIGQLLMSLLEANGNSYTPVLTRKRIYDEVCWSDGAENPWRRSATWLVLRVSLQRCLCVLLGASLGTLHFKFFMCFIHSSICQSLTDVDVMSHIPDRLAFARSKLARRLAKLQRQIDTTGHIGRMFSRHGRGFQIAIGQANSKLQNIWKAIQRKTIKSVSPLPKRADREATVLSLPNSRSFMERILGEVLYGRPTEHLRLEQRVRNAGLHALKTNAHGPLKARHYLALANAEMDLKRDLTYVSRSTYMILMQKLGQFVHVAIPAFSSDPEQMSSMLITVMETWQVLDSITVKRFPLLANYNPGFPRDLLFCLQVPRLEDMRRLRDVETYLDSRREAADNSLAPIFGGRRLDSFAVRYFDQCHDMQDLLKRIHEANRVAKDIKEDEWKQKTREYESLMREATTTNCLYINDEVNPLKRLHDDLHCRKHYLERRARRVRITVHEELLPEDVMTAKTVIFELVVPLNFAIWRDATWQILRLARPTMIGDRAPRALLRDIACYKEYMIETSCNITLASRTKSFHNTHYAQVSFPISLDKVCLPHGLRYGLFDREQSLWTAGQRDDPSFAGLCSPCLPPKSVYASLRKYIHPTFEGTNISGNEVIASQTRCPNTLNIAEFTSFQNLRLGRGIPWIRLLRELASPNLNFGTVEVSTLVSELALLAGPSKGNSSLRANHCIFQDSSFCMALAAQIKKRLDAVAANWREGQTVEIMMTLLLRIWSLASSPTAVKEAENLLRIIRQTTYGWTRLLRDEICNAKDIETAQKRSRDVFLAALLSRKTFEIEAADPTCFVKPENLTCFLECAIALQNNLPKNEANDIRKLSPYLKKMFLADLKLVYRLENQLRSSIEAFPVAVNQAINGIWAEASGESVRKYSQWNFLPKPHDGWIEAKSSGSEGLVEQTVQLDFLEGDLLIDSRPLGRLPEEYSKHEMFEQLFGARIFLTYPSPLPGMSYRLASLFHGHEIHFGFRDNNTFIRARIGGRILELIPQIIFWPQSGIVPDLPLPLIEKCVHWLDLGSRTLEIRPNISMWQAKQSDWRVNLRTSTAHRRTSLIVDPQSQIFNRVATLIEPFEKRQRMTVYQPGKGNLSLHLPELELQFRVNREGLLESQQLRAVVDLDQDAGCLYGLKSFLVLRDSVVPEDRSIIVAMGSADSSPTASTNHVNSEIAHQGFYARFFINKELGRLECAPEPRLIYFKAYCHAITSFILPDPLTGRTGTEEALHCLKAGNAQPWSPLDKGFSDVLSNLAQLTPQRGYYPENIKVLQKVVWKEAFLPTIQHAAFRPTVQDVVQQCRLLSRFHKKGDDLPVIEQIDDEHLHTRAMLRGKIHGAWQSHVPRVSGSDLVYVARDRENIAGARNVYEVSVLLKRWSKRLSVSHDLTAILREWPTIQGFNQDFDVILLTDMIDIELSAHWGSLIKHCIRSSEAVDKYKLMFTFATISFNAKTDMIVLRSLIAIAIMSQFKALQLPDVSIFSLFQGRQVPSVDFLMRMIAPHKAPFLEEEDFVFDVPLHSRRRRIMGAARMKHEEQSEESCKTLAAFLLSQWPRRELTLTGHEDMVLLDSAAAFLIIKPEWERLCDNWQLSEHLDSVQRILNTCKSGECPSSLCDRGDKSDPPGVFSSSLKVDTLIDLLQKPLEYKKFTNNSLELTLRRSEKDCSNSPHSIVQKSGQTLQSSSEKDQTSETRAPSLVSELRTIISPFACNNDAVRRTYGLDLEKSINALERFPSVSPGPSSYTVKEPELAQFAQMINSAQSALQDQFNSIKETLVHQDHWLHPGGLLPDITPITLLEALPKIAGNSTGFKAIIQYAQLMTDLQRLLRIRNAKSRNDTVQLTKEMEFELPTWRHEDHVDWLLLQIDFNLLIRQDQLEVARSLITPSSGQNSVLQMNMGQGKSSVIIPLVAAELADGRNLVRVVVPRSLLLQTAQLLQSRLGGLIGRNVKHIPFSRRTPTDSETLEAYRSLHKKTQCERGILLTLPEHMLSFQLSGLQELSNGHLKQATFMIRLQEWLRKNCRDLLDECDYMLAVKTQLIYPSGSQSMVDGHPIRWVVVQDLLKLVKTHLSQLQRQFPQGIEIIDRGDGIFPTIFFLDQDVKDTFLDHLVHSIIDGQGNLLPIDSCPQDELDCIGRFLHEATFPKAVALEVAKTFKRNVDIRHTLLLLRGLLVHRILIMGLNKRWNVQYGIDPRRDPIAVPYHSKGVPSDQSEFGHPDVSIILTCLSFYYSGLTFPQFQQSLNWLLKCDEPVREFGSWIESVRSFPDSLRAWGSISVEDEMQCTHLWSLLSRQMSVINFFLNHLVFPRHARTFERKLVSSGWDIATTMHGFDKNPFPSMKENVKPGTSTIIHDRPVSLTVGFSGTNDNKTLLPMNILQDDLPGLSHTNAEVLTYLLEPRNRQYFAAIDGRGKGLTEIAFLHKLHGHGIRMLLDAGAQIIELDNISLARTWLTVDHEAEAAVYFGIDGRAWVLYRDGRGQPLASSPFLNNLGSCLVYLDEVGIIRLGSPPKFSPVSVFHSKTLSISANSCLTF